ncbi:hypothetical protein ACFYTG_49330 [Streptomyces mirabilis]|uniref:hypothetical protein n=1 Tax=Streptomyces mirabilis TaxID=68239 RepID=UPI0036BE480E
MITARLAVGAQAPYATGIASVAVIAPQAGSGYPSALARRGRHAVAVTLGFGTRPPAYRDVAADEAYTDVIEYDGDLRRTVKKLRATGVEAVVAASSVGVELAERIAWQLRLPGNGIPGSTRLRTDRGIQSAALSQAGITAPRSLRTTHLAEALAWADRHQLSAYQLTAAALGLPVRPVSCHTRHQIAAVWPQIQEAAYRHSGNASLVLQERVEGRQYVVDSVTQLGPDGPQHTVTGIWTHLHASTGLLDRTDLVHRRSLLARRLSPYVRRTLDTLGVASGPTSCHLAFEPERGPVLLSASAVTHRSRADEAVWEITDRDPIDATLDGPLFTYRSNRNSPHICVSRIYVDAQQQDESGPQLLQDLATLPTAACVDKDPNSLISHSAALRPGGKTCEIVLAHEDSEAIEKDYSLIRDLTADLYRNRQR